MRLGLEQEFLELTKLHFVLFLGVDAEIKRSQFELYKAGSIKEHSHKKAAVTMAAVTRLGIKFIDLKWFKTRSSLSVYAPYTLVSFPASISYNSLKAPLRLNKHVPLMFDISFKY